MIIQYPAKAGRRTTRLLETGTGPREMWLLHGIGGRADRWRGCMEPLAAGGYRVRAPDLPGHGFALDTDGFDHSVAAYSGFVRDALTDNVKGGSLTLVGTSFGGQLALRVALECTRPRLDALVLCAPTGVQPLGERVRAGLADRLAQSTREDVRGRLSLLLGDTNDLEALVEEEFQMTAHPGRTASMAQLAATVRAELDAAPLADELAQMSRRIPVLLLWGGRDRSLPVELASAITAQAPDVGTHVFPQLGHMPYLQQPTTFTATVLDFLATRDNRSPTVVDLAPRSCVQVQRNQA